MTALTPASITMLHTIPPEVLNRHVAVLAMNGSGKTYGTKGTVIEPLLGDGRRVCVLDPTGVYWGLRLDPKGSGPSGLDVVIFGGRFADFVIGENHGEAVAEVIATTSRSAIIDTSDMTVGARTRFFTGFAETLLRKNRAPLHLVVDEAHLFAPQGRVADPQSGRMLHAANNLVSLGRSRGLRVVLISQRPAKLHKDSLTQAHSLVVMKLVAPQDRDAARAWIEGQPDQKRGEEVLGSLAGLQTGQGWLWAPEINVLSRIDFPKIRTFDSSRAPDEDDAHEHALPKLDTEDIRAKIEAVAAELVANDPAAMKKRIADLEEKLRFAATDATKLPAQMDDLLAQARQEGFDEAFAKGINTVTELWSEVLKIIAPIKIAVEQLEAWNWDHFDTVDGRSAGEKGGGTLQDAPAEAWHRYDRRPDSGSPNPSFPPREPSPGRAATAPPVMFRAVEQNTGDPLPVNGSGTRRVIGINNRTLAPAQLRILDALAWQASIGVRESDRETIAFLADASPKSSSYSNNLSGLRTGGMIDYRAGRLALTELGHKHAEKPTRRLTHADILAGALAKLMPIQGRILRIVVDAYPHALPRKRIAERADVSATSSSFANHLSRLRSLGLIAYQPEGKVRADDRLYP